MASEKGSAHARIGIAIDKPGPAAIVSRTARCVAGIEVQEGSLSDLGSLSTYQMLALDRTAAAQLAPHLSDLPQTRLVIVSEDVDDELLWLAAQHPSINGLLFVSDAAPRSFEITYAIRRMLGPTEPPPMLSALLSWGATSLSWMPDSAIKQQHMVDLIERAAVSLGIERRLADVVGTAAHELSMNALYCPRDPTGARRPIPARSEDLTLPEALTPEIRLTIDGAFLSLDCADRFGQLRRSDFFGAILKGRSGTLRDEPAGTRGSGLGLHTLFAAGSLLRAEVTPGELSLVSWGYDRSRTGRTRRQTPRSLWFW